ncbi:hypothetical protein M427DRAFT_46501 [Gonapodya prolifera JEL478]|uniref:Uncharacterized protein n=1 Tax=Gonapodya prolifera (strain JEL478) TaxID=1344416 RepID=A0A139A6G6_GONPJ|nr:hypothetical protein M427DRAFT_46501 [Gonapodya prolifera JEL478]|eukprot:KXS12239.1 hypothetical protein M427DRAFT_46501 [Gonapodya prolifera JEL478]
MALSRFPPSPPILCDVVTFAWCKKWAQPQTANKAKWLWATSAAARIHLTVRAEDKFLKEYRKYNQQGDLLGLAPWHVIVEEEDFGDHVCLVVEKMKNPPFLPQLPKRLRALLVMELTAKYVHQSKLLELGDFEESLHQHINKIESEGTDGHSHKEQGQWGDSSSNEEDGRDNDWTGGGLGKGSSSSQGFISSESGNKDSYCKNLLLQTSPATDEASNVEADNVESLLEELALSLNNNKNKATAGPINATSTDPMGAVNDLIKGDKIFIKIFNVEAGISMELEAKGMAGTLGDVKTGEVQSAKVDDRRVWEGIDAMEIRQVLKSKGAQQYALQHIHTVNTDTITKKGGIKDQMISLHAGGKVVADRNELTKVDCQAQDGQPASDTNAEAHQTGHCLKTCPIGDCDLFVSN